MTTTACVYILAASLLAGGDGAASRPAAQSVNIRLTPSPDATPAAVQPTFTARFTPDELKMLLSQRSDLLPLALQFEAQQEAYLAALDRINMGALVDKLGPFLSQQFPERFHAQHDLIRVPVPPENQVELEVPELKPDRYRGPKEEVIGFLLHDVAEQDYLNVAVRVVHTARQMLDSRDPAFDRSSPRYYELAAEREIEELLARRRQAYADAKSAEKVTHEVAQALGLQYDPATGKYRGQPNWVKESRRFSYVIQKDGKFIDKLRPLVEQINKDLEAAGFTPPTPLDRPGIHFDEDLGDVEILLPKPLMESFLEQVDHLEQRMAEDHMISIEAVRLTDRDIINGAIAARLNVVSQGVHDVNRNLATQAAIQQFGVNSLLAVANRQLEVSSLQRVAAGVLPAGFQFTPLPALVLPTAPQERTYTTVGGDFSVGADEIFFDGREQSYGFSYIGPDGLRHTLSLDVVDSLREFWDRIERNLIVHKIRKTDKPEEFTVPVGPKEGTFQGIAALISEENQEVVVATGTGALSQLSATAGTWLIIRDFDIEPIPGSATTLTVSELQEIEDRVLLTMLLRDPDPLIDLDLKRCLLDTSSHEELRELLYAEYEKHKDRPVRPGRSARTLAEVYDQRRRAVLEDAAVEKKERNSRISLTFYSSQGNIIRTPGDAASLGDANDLTSFTTEVRPNMVTPISSFFTKSAGGARGSSVTGIPKGEQSSEEKTMTHLVIRVRFPTAERERSDLQEGRHLGYFELPLGRTPHSTVDLPFLSSSQHPLDRLAKLRFGLMFATLQEERVRRPFSLVKPDAVGMVSARVWETATTRFLLNRRIISGSPGSNQSLADEYLQCFIVEVRSLLEYDEDFFDAPNVALRNMMQWNNPERIALALRNSPGKFALERLILIIDELGEALVGQDYAADFLARSPPGLFHHRLYCLTDDELRTLRRDVANHYLRLQEAYGDAFLEAISIVLQLGTYRATGYDQLMAGPLRGYHDLVVFDNSAAALADPELFEEAHADFLTLKHGGYKGGLFQPSLECIEHMPEAYRRLVIRGRDVLTHPN